MAALIDQPGRGLSLVGPVNFTTVLSVYQQGLPLINRKANRLSIHLAGVTHQDSSILALLSGWIRYTMEQQQALTYTGVPPSLQQLIQLNGLEAIFPTTL